MCGDNDTCRCWAWAVPLAVALWAALITGWIILYGTLIGPAVEAVIGGG